MKSIKIIVFLNLIFISSLNAQSVSYKNWAIGNGGGISFQNGLISQFQSQMSCQDMGSTISDAFGNLLFYCNGTTVYNKNHSVMLNGTGLLGDITGGHAALILPQPETKFYYIFTIDKYADSNGLRYHIVDISADNGLGEVVTKNVILINPASEKIAAVWNQAQNCYKVITHEFGNNEFHVFELNNSGLNTTPVISAIGASHQNGIYGQSHDALGQMSISPDGSKLAIALCFSSLFEIFNFDINTGIITNPISFGGYTMAWGIEFSPNSQFIYFTQWTHNKVYQADISSGNAISVAASIEEVGSISGAGQYSVGYLSRTPDGRIFIAKYGYDNLATISNPNLAGASSNFNEAGFLLNFGSSTAGLSTYAVFPNEANFIHETDETSFKIIPNPSTNNFAIQKRNGLINSSLKIKDVEGKSVYSKMLNDYETVEFFNIDLQAGIYFVVIESEGRGITINNQKLVITK